jgi:general secretion pathway protein J
MATTRANRGFTLIELLVAIAIMALLALVSWQGLEGMARAQSINRERCRNGRPTSMPP